MGVDLPKYSMLHPGEILQDFLDERDMVQDELAALIGREVDEIADVITGTADISLDLSDDLGVALGTSTLFWYKLQVQYDTFQALRAEGDA